MRPPNLTDADKRNYMRIGLAFRAQKFNQESLTTSKHLFFVFSNRILKRLWPKKDSYLLIWIRRLRYQAKGFYNFARTILQLLEFNA